MASLLERMNIDSPATGPQRTRSRNGKHSPLPYARPPKGDVNAPWTHDQFNAHNTLLDRMGTAERTAPPKTNFARADRALREATGQSAPPTGPLSIRGASTRNVIEVSGLVTGTTAEDVQAIFKQCGTITSAVTMSSSSQQGVTVRLTFKSEKDAQDAVRKFNGQVADGRELKVSIIGGSNTTLSGRLGVGALDGNSVDALMSSSNTSKLRSDEILKDEEERARAHVLVAPPGTDPREYTQLRHRGRGGRRRGGGARGRTGRGGASIIERMDTD